jgi:hypothetical protein
MTDPDPDAIAAGLSAPQEAPEMASEGDRGPELEKPERPPFPLGCPIRPLGVQQDITGMQRCYYLNFNGQLVGLEAGTRHGKNSLVALFGPQSDWLELQWPQWSKPIYEGRGKERELVVKSQIVGFNQADASRALIEECVRMGVFNPAGRMRGTGAHELATGRGLVLHCGDRLCVSDLNLDGAIRGFRWEDPGLLGGMVYVADEPIPRPWHETVHPSAAEGLLRLLGTWNWRRPVLDARFVLGAIGLSPLAGAARWRPHIWITGGKGTGKTTLNGKGGVVHQCFGEGVFRTGNASAAGIRQHLRNSTVPVMFDEIEASANNARVSEVIELARVAASGDTMTRGGADHTAREFTLQSCFWFSSINIPPLQPQDRSRLAILELEPFAPEAVPPNLAALNLPDLGRKLMRRMVEGWWRLEATKQKFHAALAYVGHDNRACDQFGILLAAADVLLHDWDTRDGLPDQEEINHWAALCRPQHLAEVSEATPDHVACLNHIITTTVQARGGDEREALGTWIGRVVGLATSPVEDWDAQDRATRRLEQIGLRVVNAKFHPEERGIETVKPARWGSSKFHQSEPGFLAVAQGHQGLARIFDGTTWQGQVWYQALKRVPGALEAVTVRFGKVSLRAVLVPISVLLDDEDLPPASRAEALAEWRAVQEGAPA